jgi:hypothetical protein
MNLAHLSALTWAEYGGILTGGLVLVRRQTVKRRRRRYLPFHLHRVGEP